MTEKLFEFKDPMMVNLAKLDFFVITALFVTVVSYYQIVDLFETPHQMTVNVSIAIGFIFAGLLSMSIRTYTKKKKGDRQ